jgi:glucose-6-phosphate 1-epimerase
LLLLPSQITVVQHAGHNALQLSSRHGKAVISLHGAHLLSWVPTGQRDVFWLSPKSLPEPAAIRGGVPVCWPWFAKQGQPSSAAQHGPVRNLTWQISTIHNCIDDEVSVSFEPAEPLRSHGLAGVPSGLQVSLRVTLGQTLRQTLHTHNLGSAPFQLTQALHSYYAVSQAQRVAIEGLQGLTYTDRLRDLQQDVQHAPFLLDQACDRTYEHAFGASGSHNHRYQLTDPDWQRRIDIDVQGSRSVVVWNPGRENARVMPDVPDEGWPDFICIEAANAGPDVIILPAGQAHALTQNLSVSLTH